MDDFAPEWLLVLAVDIESTGRLRECKIISIGFCGVTKSGGVFRNLFLMPGIRLPCDHHGPLLLSDGSVRQVRPLYYNDFDRATWAWWTSEPSRAKALAKQIDWSTQGMETNASMPLRAAQLERMRFWVDEVCERTTKQGGRVLLATDDPGFDIGEIGHELKRYCTRTQYEPCGLQFIPRTRKRRHQHVNDISFAMQQRREGILDFDDYVPPDDQLAPTDAAAVAEVLHSRATGIEGKNAHVADIDATASALVMAGYIQKFPNHVRRLGRF
jgi:hypothetical protein